MTARARWIALGLPLVALAALLVLRALGGDRAGAAPDPASAARSPDPPQREPPELAAAERDPAAGRAPASAAAPRSLALLLVDPAGAPVAAASWLAFRGSQVLASGTTGADGRARIELPSKLGDPGAAGELELVALHAEIFPLRAVLATTPPRQTVVLGAGAPIAGRVRVEGAPPAEPLRLELRDAGWDPLLDADDLAPEVLEALATLDLDELATTTDGEGRFRFRGLPVGWRGELDWSGFLVAGSTPGDEHASTLEVTAPREGLPLDLVRAPELSGRVVDPAGEPVPRPQVRATSEGYAPGRRPRRVEDDGSFRFVYAQGLPARVELDVGDADGAARRTHVVEVPPGVYSWDVGPLAVAPTRAVAFRVRDARGAPIAGASVRGMPGSGATWVPAVSDERGLGIAAVPLAAAELLAAADGYEPASARIPAMLADGERVEVALAQAGTLEIVLPAAARDLYVHVQLGAEKPFWNAGVASWSPPRDEALHFFLSQDGADGFLLLRGADDGRYVLRGVRAGIELEVAAADTVDHRVDARVVPPLAPGERRVVELAAGVAVGSLRGRIVGPGGERVPDASLVFDDGRVAEGGRVIFGASVDADGRFATRALAVARATVVAVAAGFPAKRFRGLVVGGPEVELVLDAGRAIRVVVVDGDGDPVPELALDPSKLRDAWWTSAATEERPGEYVVADAPPGELVFDVLAGGRRIPARIAADRDATRVELPAGQACVVALTGARELPAGERAEAVLVPLGVAAGRTLTAVLETDAREARFQRVQPGRYEAFVRRGGEERLSDAVAFDVLPDAPARVEVALRER